MSTDPVHDPGTTPGTDTGKKRHKLRPETRDALVGLGAILSFFLVPGIVYAFNDKAPIADQLIGDLILAAGWYLWYRRKLLPSLPDRRTSVRHGRTPWAYLGLLLLVVTWWWLVGQTLAQYIEDHNIDQTYQNSHAQLTTASVYTSIALILIIAPLTEEIVMRGVIFTLARRHFAVLTASLISGVIFALLHGNLTQILYTVPIGVVCAMAYQATERLRWPILTHMVSNFTAVIVPMSLIHTMAESAVVIPLVACGALAGIWFIYYAYMRTPDFTEDQTAALLALADTTDQTDSPGCD